jgi:hypothetical protein
MANARPSEARRRGPFVEANRRVSDGTKEVKPDASRQTRDALHERSIAERFKNRRNRRQGATVGGKAMKIDHRLGGRKGKTPFKNSQIDEGCALKRRERDERTCDGVVQRLKARAPRGTATKRRSGRQDAAVGAKPREEIDGAKEREPRRKELQGERQRLELAKERNECGRLVRTRRVGRPRTAGRPQKKLGSGPIERLADRQRKRLKLEDMLLGGAKTFPGGDEEKCALGPIQKGPKEVAKGGEAAISPIQKDNDFAESCERSDKWPEGQRPPFSRSAERGRKHVEKRRRLPR